MNDYGSRARDRQIATHFGALAFTVKDGAVIVNGVAIAVLETNPAKVDERGSPR